MNFPQATAASHDYEGDGPISVIEAGIHSLQQGHRKEGLALFTLARVHSDATSSILTDTLDTLLASLQGYWNAQQALQDASRRFVEAEAEQELQLRALQCIMRALPNRPKRSCDNPSSQIMSQREASERATIAMALFPANADLQPEKQELRLTISCFGHFTVKRGSISSILGQTAMAR